MINATFTKLLWIKVIFPLQKNKDIKLVSLAVSGSWQKFFFVIGRLYFRHCKVQINKDYKSTHYTPFPLSKQKQNKKKLANRAKRKEKNLQRKKKTYKNMKNLQGQLSKYRKNKTKKVTSTAKEKYV